MAEKNLALLIDAENISPDYMSIIRDEANKYGNLSYKAHLWRLGKSKS
ncbi:MAG: hypothetical protein ACOX3C_01675 [Bacilli bacterium]